MRSVALDLAVRKITMCEVADGRVVQRRTAGSLGGLQDVLGSSCPPARVAIEACREAWHVHDVLTGWSNDVVLVDTTRVRQLGIGQHGRKTDRLDAEVLARALERNAIPVAHLLSPQRRQLRLILGSRRSLVEARAQHVTTVRGLVSALGVRLPSCDTGDFVLRVRSAALDDSTRSLVAPLLSVLVTLGQQIAAVDSQLEQLCAMDPTIAQLTTAPGVGVVVAAAFVSVIDEANRFRGAHQVAAYLGLVPSEDSSGGRSRLGAITKQGNSYLRAMLVQSAWCILRSRHKDEPLRAWGLAVAKRRGKLIAAVAVARRLAGVLWGMWRDGTVYEPGLVGRASATGLHRHAQSIELQASAMKRAADKARSRARRIQNSAERTNAMS